MKIRPLPSLFLASVFLLAPFHIGAEELLFTTGTSIQSENARNTVYLLWQETQPFSDFDRSFAIFRKPGTASSTLPFEKVGEVAFQTDVLTIAGILSRAEALLNDRRDQLSETLESLFGGIISGLSGQPVQEKLALVMQIALVDPGMRENLSLLCRLHPGAAMAAGRSFSIPDLKGIHTFEIRELDQGTGSIGAVVGRVTLNADSPRLLPAPGSPHALVEASSRGHLNVRLLWSTPDELRRLSLLQDGYHVYRINRTFAERQNYHLNPPGPDLVEFLSQHEPSVRRINRLPILTGERLSETQASALANDPLQADFFFAADDNERHRGGRAFIAGSEYYYFVAARDVLGRPGLLSPGKLVMVCDRMPPPPPTGVRVDNHFSFDPATNRATHALKVRWDPVPDEDIAAYFVYRFRSIAEIQSATAADYRTESNAVAGPISSGDPLVYVDMDIQGSGEHGRTWFYTVRALDEGSCSPGNLSGHSAPAYGVLRDRRGPERPTITAFSLSGEARFLSSTQSGPVSGIAPESVLPRLLLVAKRLDPALDWVEFLVDGFRVGRVEFGSDDLAELLIPDIRETKTGERIFLARAGGQGLTPGLSPPVVSGTIPSLKKDAAFRIYWEVDVFRQYQPADGLAPPHLPIDPVSGERNCIELDLKFPADTTEFKVYRKFGDGPDVLLSQGLSEGATTLRLNDCSPPSSGGQVCYYLQVFDANGNPSPVSVPACVFVHPSQPMPVPMIAQASSVRLNNQAFARITFFCSPHGVDRFEILTSPEDRAGSLSGPDLSARLDAGGLTISQYPDSTFLVRQTGRVGVSLQSEDGALYSVLVPVEEGVPHEFVVRSAGVGSFNQRAVSSPSNRLDFLYVDVPEEEDPVLVPWPARPIASVEQEYQGLKPRFVSNIYNAFPPQTALFNSSMLIPVGTFTWRNNEGMAVPVTAVKAPFPIPEEDDPHSYLLPVDTQGRTLLPAVVYRYQIPNDTFPVVSGEIVQVTPLLREIAYETNADFADYLNTPFSSHFEAAPKQFNVIHDRFFRVVLLANQSFQTPTHGLYIVDHQPVLVNASYRYLIVRFTDTGEVDRVFPTPTVTADNPSLFP